MITIFLFPVILITSCSPQRRLERLVRSHPELLSNDTVRVTDTIITLPVKADTAIFLGDLTDTLKLHKENLNVNILRIADSLWISGECRPDTIIRSLEFPVEKIKVVKNDKVDLLIRKMPWVVTGLFILCIVLLLIIYWFKPPGLSNRS